MEWKLILLVVIVLFGKLSNVKSAPPPAGGSGVPPKADLKPYLEYEYRLVNWCIVGQGEHLLYRWPFNQLKHFILQANRGVRKFEDNLKANLEGSQAQKPESITVEFNKINCELTKDYIGDGEGNYYHRAHVVIKSDVDFQGLIIQGNHAPFGLGFPFGQFDIDQEFECSDCRHAFGKIIPCISRPDVSLMHPTVGAFHYLHKRPWDRFPVGQKKEVHFNFKWAHTECSSARIVEFWVLMILDFDRPVWIVEKFGPYEFQPDKKKQDAINGEEDWKTRVPQPFLPSPILPRCWPLPTMELEYIPIPPPAQQAPLPSPGPTSAPVTGPPTPPAPPPPPAPGPTTLDPTATTPRGPSFLDEDGPDIPPMACYREYGHKYNATMCYLWKEHRRQQYLTTEAPGPDSIPGRPSIPRFKSQIKCEEQGAYFSADFDKKGTWSPIRFAGTFDTDCVLFFNRRKSTDNSPRENRWPYQVCRAWQAQFICQDAADTAANAPWPLDTTYPKRLFPLSRCNPCPTPSTTKAPKASEAFVLIKRTTHGAMMTVAFFFLFPVSLTIARFYKETCHTREVKGYRTWLCIHIIMALLALFLVYMSYTVPAFSEMNLHMYLGYASAFCCVAGLPTGWIRNKDLGLRNISIFIHTAVGYAGWGLGLASMALARSQYNNIRYKYYTWFVAGSGGFSIFSMIVLTVNICTNDYKMEIRPKRSHFPEVEIRFDDVFPSGQRFRKIFLAFYIIVQFAICGMMLTYPLPFMSPET